MKINNNEHVLTFDFRTYKSNDPSLIKYNTSEKEIWYGSPVKEISNDTSLKIKYIFNCGFNYIDDSLELLFDQEKEFQSIDWKNSQDVLKINRYINNRIKEISISDIINIITTISLNNWTNGFKFGQEKIQQDLQTIIGLKNAKS